MLDQLAAWIRSADARLTCVERVEQHRPQRAGHAVPREPYATLWVTSDRELGRPLRVLDLAATMTHRTRRIQRVAVDLYGDAAQDIARVIDVASYRVEARAALSPHTITRRERIVHPSAQQRTTLLLDVHCVFDDTYSHATIDDVEVTGL